MFIVGVKIEVVSFVNDNDLGWKLGVLLSSKSDFQICFLGLVRVGFERSAHIEIFPLKTFKAFVSEGISTNRVDLFN